MKQPEVTERRIRQLLAGDEADLLELNELLKKSEEARPLVARILAEESALIGELRSRQSAKWAESLDEKILQPPETLTADRWSWNPAKTGFAMGAALVACVAILAALAINFFPDSPEAPAGQTGNGSSIQSIGLVTALEGSGEDSQFKVGSTIEEGTFEIGPIRMRIDLNNGVKLSFTGPAHFSLRKDGCRLLDGELMVDSGGYSTSFPVETRLGRFVDQGSVFAVSVDSSGRTGMSVNRGSVNTELLSTEGDIISRHSVPSQRGLLVSQPSGEYELVSASSLNHSPLIPIPNLPLEVSGNYREAIRRASPMIWWNFDQGVRESAIPNEMGPEFQGKIEGAIKLEQAPGGNQFAVFGRGGSVGSLRPSEILKRKDDAPLTVEMWVRPDRIQHGHLVNIGVHGQVDPITKSRVVTPLSWLFVELTKEEDEDLLPAYPTLRAGFRSPPSASGRYTIRGGVNVNLFSGDRYAIGEWSHVVVRTDGEKMSMFVNGLLVSEQPLSWIRGASLDLELMLGRLDNGPDSEPIRPFVGAFDEIAVYERALTDREIRAHYHAMGAGDRRR